MKRTLLALTLAAGFLGGSSHAWAVGCVSGAVAGGVAGHVAGHHGLLGAAAGCAIGHHYHARHVREQHQRDMQQNGDYQTR